MDELQPTGLGSAVDATVIGNELDDATRQVLQIAPLPLLYPNISRVALNVLVVRYDPYTDITDEDTRVPMSVIVPLPTNYIRLVRVRVAGWKKPIDELYTVNTQAYKKQVNSFERATVLRPLGAVVPMIWCYGYTVVTSGTPPVDTTTYTYVYSALELFPAPADMSVFSQPTRPTTDPEDDLDRLARDQYLFDQQEASAEKQGGLLYFNEDGVDPVLMVPELLYIAPMPVESVVDPKLADAIVWLAVGRMFVTLREPNLAKVAETKSMEVLQAATAGIVTEG